MQNLCIKCNFKNLNIFYLLFVNIPLEDHLKMLVWINKTTSNNSSDRQKKK